MSLLQPWVLVALPLALLPLVIHLIHRRRHRVVEWGAMMFLLEGSRSSRGRQRLREILLLVARVLAVLGLILTLGRPLAGGWVGWLAGERVDAVVVILDRSASMGEAPGPGPESKLDLALGRIVPALEALAPTEIVAVDGVRPDVALRLEGPTGLAELAAGGATEAPASIVAAAETALTHLAESASGRAEIWLVSDGQISDWRPDDGRWAPIVEALASAPAGARVRLDLDTSRRPDNLSVRVERARHEVGAGTSELVLDVVVTRAEEPALGDGLVVPLAIEVAGARSSVDVELVGREARLVGHRVPVDAQATSGFGSVALVGDARPADDRYWFVYGGDSTLETLVACERSDVERVVSIAAASPIDPSWEHATRAVDVRRSDLDATGAALVVWQGPLPGDAARATLEDFVADGGVVLFLPPETPSNRTFAGLGWGAWRSSDAPTVAATWRTDDDLLRDGEDGTPLPVGELELRRTCSIVEDADAGRATIALASLESGAPLLSRAVTPRGGVYFLGVLPTPDSSDLASQGVVLVAVVRRALEEALQQRGSETQRTTGPDSRWQSGEWRAADPLSQDTPPADRGLRGGVLRNDDAFVALNRPDTEDASPLEDPAALRAVFGEVDVVVADAEGEDDGGLVEEIWRLVLAMVLVALIGEQLLGWSEGSAPRGGESP